MSLHFSSVAAPGLFIDQRFEVGLTALVCSPDATARSVVELASGLASPERGVVTLGGEAPARNPRLRARIATLLWDEPAPRGQNVLEWLGCLRTLHLQGGTCLEPLACLEQLGVAELAQRGTDGASPRDRRAAMLALACGISQPSLLLLWDPFGIAGIDRTRLSELLSQRATTLPVVFITTEPSDAELLDAQVYHLVGGRLLPAPRSAPVSYRVCAEGASRLMAALLTEPSVLRVSAPHDARTLEVSGNDARELSLTLSKCLQQSGARLISLTPAAQNLEALQASARGSADAAYANAGSPSANVSTTLPALQPRLEPPRLEPAATAQQRGPSDAS